MNDMTTENTPKDTTPKTAPKSTPKSVDEDYEAFQAWKTQREAEREAAKPKDVEWYLHLANGDVERVKESDHPDAERLAHFIKNGHAHTVIGVYPVETKTSTAAPEKKDEQA